MGRFSIHPSIWHPLEGLIASQAGLSASQTDLIASQLGLRANQPGLRASQADFGASLPIISRMDGWTDRSTDGRMDE